MSVNINLNGIKEIDLTLPGNVTTSVTDGVTSISETIAFSDISGQSTTQTVVNASTSGTVTFSQPFQTSSYKKVIIYCSTALGTASYIFPSPFVNTPAIITTNELPSSLVTTLTTTAVTVTGSSSIGFIIIEGY